MLETLAVRNLAVIREAQVDFSAGLNILTGETGAGKSVILGSVNLALGQKAQKELIRDGAKEASCQLVFHVEDEKKREALCEEGFETEEERLILSRRISANKSICRIGGEMVTASKLREVSSGLIDIHGQRDSRFLLNKKYHLRLLDDFGAQEDDGLAAAYRKAYETCRSLEKTLSENERSDEERLREISFLEYETGEIETAGLHEGEDEALEAQYRMMSHSRQVIEALSEAMSLCGPDGAGDALQRATRTVSSVTRYGSDLPELYDQMEEVSSLLGDLERSLREAIDAHTFDEEEFTAVRERLDEINRLKQKYGRSIPAIRAAYEEKCAQLERLRSYQAWKEETERAYTLARHQAQDLADRLTKIRRRKASALEEKMSQTLLSLNFLQADFRVRIEEAPLSSSGADDVSFYISTNPGEPPGPIEKVASGGELSRIMLALRTVSAMTDGGQTLIFDEIDSGISGRTAQKVGELLKNLSKTNQIICITHLPQIAAMADQHYLIEKTIDDDRTISSIRLLDEEESIEELARMLGGAQITEAALENARQMHKAARNI